MQFHICIPLYDSTANSPSLFTITTTTTTKRDINIEKNKLKIIRERDLPNNELFLDAIRKIINEEE